jgi:hypothetical protein
VCVTVCALVCVHVRVCKLETIDAMVVSIFFKFALFVCMFVCACAYVSVCVSVRVCVCIVLALSRMFALMCVVYV